MGQLQKLKMCYGITNVITASDHFMLSPKSVRALSDEWMRDSNKQFDIKFLLMVPKITVGQSASGWWMLSVDIFVHICSLSCLSNTDEQISLV